MNTVDRSRSTIVGGRGLFTDQFLHHEITRRWQNLQAFSRIDGFLREIDVGFIHPATPAKCVLANDRSVVERLGECANE